MDRNCTCTRLCESRPRSLSARRAWIEIRYLDNIEISQAKVALRKESVDRNRGIGKRITSRGKSLSARRAWIEIEVSESESLAEEVALRKESVDRNKYVVQCRKTLGVSLSARRAWIEITLVQIIISGYASRSPQGERG